MRIKDLIEILETLDTEQEIMMLLEYSYDTLQDYVKITKDILNIEKMDNNYYFLTTLNKKEVEKSD